MFGPEKIIRGALVLLTAGTALACDAKSSVNLSPLPNDVQKVQTIIPPESPLIPEQRRRGIQLENLDFTGTEGTNLNPDHVYKAGTILIGPSGRNYEVILNQEAFSSVPRQCEVDNVKTNIYLELPDDEKHGFRLRPSQGFDGILLVGISESFQEGEKQLDRYFDVNPEKRAKAVYNLSIILLNALIMKDFCTAILLNQATLSPQELKTKSEQIYNQYLSSLLAGEKPLLIVRPKTKTQKV